MQHEFTNIIAWQKARALNVSIYRITSDLPESEKYNLTSQMRRSAVSISSNIAEGSGASTPAQFGRYLTMAIGSVCELESQVYLSHDLEYINKQTLQAILIQTDEVKRLILGFRKSILKDIKH